MTGDVKHLRTSQYIAVQYRTVPKKMNGISAPKNAARPEMLSIYGTVPLLRTVPYRDVPYCAVRTETCFFPV